MEGNKKSGRRLLPGLAMADGYTRHPFDEEHGVRTSGLIAGRHLLSGHKHDRHATAYYGVSPSVWRAVMRKWLRSNPAAPVEETTFVDVGAGMGRALLLASEMPFREVVGVELNPVLARMAKRNRTRWQAAKDAAGRSRARSGIRIVEGDAAEFAWPEGACLGFLFNPFGATVLRRMLAECGRQFGARVGGGAGQLDLLYVNDEQEAVLAGYRGFERLFRERVERSRADAIADHRILANQLDGEYASSNYENCSGYRWMGRG